MLLGLLVPFVVVGGANAVTEAWWGEDDVANTPKRAAAPAGTGVTGELPRQRKPSVRLLRDSASLDDPRTTNGVRVPEGRFGVPEPLVKAYRGASRRIAGTHPSCGLHWSVLAAIGRVESGHARSVRLDERGTTATAILGPRLDGGPEVAAVPDSDAGRLDGDPVWDRAVGPMQFLPSTWARFGADGNGDGKRSPHNVHDAALAAARYLCTGGGRLHDGRELARAVFRYNHSESYVREVLGWATAYRTGVRPTEVELVAEVPEVDVPAPVDDPGITTPRPTPSRETPHRTFPPLSPAPEPAEESGPRTFSP
ncbi:lytic transglycosylase domain-containing protein, partial [Actinopolyspora mortivallis]|uniref:lytic transglycosylase domain-containing protein n=1 Tax=Actinopolyspora mortivallis TaxID=33906 RepID=UPI001C62E8C7